MNTNVLTIVAVAGLLLATRTALVEFDAGNYGWGLTFIVGVLAVVLFAVTSRRRTAWDCCTDR